MTYPATESKIIEKLRALGVNEDDSDIDYDNEPFASAPAGDAPHPTTSGYNHGRVSRL